MTREERNYERFATAIEDNGISAEDVLSIFTNWHGLQLMTDEFIENLPTEGYYVEGLDEEEGDNEDE